MAISYPCQVGLPEDLDPAIKAYVFLCCDFRIISQEHNGSHGLDGLRGYLPPDPLTVWAAAVDRGDTHFEMVVLAHQDWLEWRLRLFAGDSKETFLQIIFRQARQQKGHASKRRIVHDCGWSFTSMAHSDTTLQEWIRVNWPSIYRERIDVLALREMVPVDQRLLANSPFMYRLITDLFGWLSNLRAA